MGKNYDHRANIPPKVLMLEITGIFFIPVQGLAYTTSVAAAVNPDRTVSPFRLVVVSLL